MTGSIFVFLEHSLLMLVLIVTFEFMSNKLAKLTSIKYIYINIFNIYILFFMDARTSFICSLRPVPW